MSEVPEETISSKLKKSKIQGPQNLNGENKKSLLLEIDPHRCRPWKFHNRDTAWLTKERCQDLIHSIEKNGQIEPVLVRQIEDDPNYDFELICGVRRWFACSQIPNRKLLALLTNADDKTCMILMHVENANSKDISEFERAFSFSQQLQSGIFKNQVEMAEALSLTQGYISKMVNAAEIFEYSWIQPLFKSKLDIPIKYAYALSILLKKSETSELIKEKSLNLQKEQEKTGCLLSSTEILKRLISHARLKIHSLSETVILMANNKPVITCHQNKFGKVSIVIEKEVETLNRFEVEKACVQVIQEHVLEKLFPGE